MENENITEKSQNPAPMKLQNSVKKNRVKRADWQLHVMMIVPVILLIIFAYIPLYGLRIAFVEEFNPVKGIWGSEWGGWKWFKFMFEYPTFWPVFRNTLFIAVAKIVFGFPVPIIFALLLNEIGTKHFKKGVQTIVYLPNFLSWVIVGGMIFRLFGSTGTINLFLGRMGIKPVQWLTNDAWFLTILVGSEIWKGFGFNAIYYLAALTGIDKTLYEAAELDGAGRMSKCVHITLPGIMPIIMLLGILNLGGILNAGFEQILILYNQDVKDVAEIIDTLVYQMGIKQFNTEFATAVGLFRNVVGAVLFVTANVLAYKFTDYRII